MRHGRRLLHSLIVSLLTIVVLMNSGLFGPAPIGMASAQAIARAQAAQASQGDKGRFVPNTKSPTLPVGTWHYPGNPRDYGLKSGTASASTTSMVSQRTPGEQVDLRTASTSTFLNADGTWTLKSYQVPVHYQDTQGHWQNIDSSIVSDTSDPGYAFGNKANSWHVHFANQAGGPVLMHIQQPGLTLMDTLQGAAAVHASTSGNEIVYAGVFPNVDLRYWLGMSHVEEMLLLQSAQVPASYTFSYHIPGASAYQDASGAIIVTDAQGHILGAIGGIQMYEANAHGDMLPTGAGTSAVKVALSGSGPGFTITLTPDKSWLANPARKFPVAIDPTYSGADQGEGGGTNGNIYGDTFVESGNPTWAFYNNNTERIGDANAMPSTATGYGTGVDRTYIKFPVGSAPSRVHVTSANVQLYQLDSWSGGTQINANEIKPAWDETTLTWNNQPSVWGKGSGNSSSTYNVNIHIDVTAVVYDWWQNNQANNGIQLLYANESKAADLFASDDRGSNLPVLTINYVQDLTAPTASGVTVDNGAAYTNNASVTLGPSYSDTNATNVWSSNWASVNGVGAVGYGAAHWATDASGTQLIADTSSCGGTQCWAQTFFTNTVSTMSNWPTYTAMFKTDYVPSFHFGVISSGNAATRVDLTSASSTTAFDHLEYSTAAGAYNSTTVNVPISANTWYYGQVRFPLSNVVEMRFWQVGQPIPTSPTISWTGIAMSNPGLNFWEYGDSSANLHHYYVGNVTVTSGSPAASPVGYGVYGMQFSNDNATWSCPAPAGGTWCVASQRQAGWNLPSGDGRKTVYLRDVDNAGNSSTSAASPQIILDTTAPTESVTGPASGRELRGVVTVSATASDPTAGDGSNSGMVGGAAGVSLFVDGVQVGVPVTTTTTPTFLWDTTNVTPGEHVLTVQATDAAGNTSTSAGVTVDVSNGGQMPHETYAMRGLPSGDSAGLNVATGDAVVESQDIDIAGRGPDLALSREFDSLAPSDGLFGWGWTSNLDEHVTSNAYGSVTYHDATGGYHVFLPNGSGGYLTSPGLYLTLVKNADSTYMLTSHDQSTTQFTASGYLWKVQDRNGNTLTYAYSGATLLNATDASGRTLTFTVTNGHITGITAPGSRTYGYAYDANGNLTGYTDPAGVVTHYTYDGSHHITSITANYIVGGTNYPATLGYDTANRLVSLVDPMGYDVGVTFGALGSGQTVVQQLQTNSSTTPSTTNSVYESTTYQQTTDGSGAIAQITNPIGTAATFTYDSTDKLTSSVVDAGDSTHLNLTTNWTYDSNGNELTQMVDPGTGHLALTTTWTYDGSNNVTTETDPHGYVTQYTYDTPATGDLTKVVKDYVSGGPTDQQTNVTTTYTYDTYGEVLASTDPLGIVTQYTYDTQGDRLTTTQNYKSGVAADSQTNVQTSATYDALGQTLTSTDALGIVTQYAYDINGNVMQAVANYKSGVAADSQTNVTSSATYDALGRKATETNPRGIVTKYDYDNDGRATQTTQNYKSGVAADSQTNVAMTTAYDGAGNATVATDAKGNTTTTTYDLANRATEVVQKASSVAGGAQISDKTTTYDAVGRTVSTQVLDNNTNPITSYTYDAAGRKATQSDPPASPGATDQSGQPNVTTYTYDADGNVTETKVTNSLASPTTVSDTTAVFDKVNIQTSKTEEASSTNPQTTTYAHDPDGRQTSFTDPSNKTTTNTYDALGRTLMVTDASNSVTTSTYDAAGRRLTQSNSAGTTTDNYDALGRVSSESRTDGANVIQTIVTSTYDANGNLTQKSTTNTNSQVTTLTYSYDALDRQATMSDGTRSYQYDANGNVTQLLVVNGSNNAIKISYGYDGGNRLTSLTDQAGPANATLHTYSYAYDGSGNRNSVTEDGVTTTYVYDGDNQLTQVKNGATVTEQYTYDASHNRTSLVTSAGTTSYTYNATNALTQKTDPNGKVTQYTYDTTNGNLLSATYDPTPGVNQVTNYAYDANQRLSQVTKPDGTTVAFAYDADGNRLSKTITSGTTTTVVNDTYQSGQLVSESDGSGTLLATFTYDVNGVPSSVQVGSDLTTAPRYYYSYNGHGDVVALTDAGGTTVATYSYDTFGVPTIWESFTNGWHNPFLYDGHDGARYDSETGLYWLSVRAYDPTLGRFISRDPLGRVPLFFADQPYAYAGNNPLVNVDPSGQRPFMEGASAAQQAQVNRVMQHRARIYWSTHHPWWHSCRYNTEDESSVCKNYRAWEGKNAARRDNDLTGMRIAIGVMLIAGLIAVVASDWFLLNSSLNLREELTAGKDLIITVISELVLAITWFFPRGTQIYAVAAAVAAAMTAAAQVALAAFNAFAAAYAAAGWAASIVALGFNAVRVLIGGVPEVGLATLKTLAEQFGGAAILHLINAGGHALLAGGNALMAVYNYQANEPIWDWCSQNGGACTSPPASGYMQ